MTTPATKNVDVNVSTETVEDNEAENLATTEAKEKADQKAIDDKKAKDEADKKAADKLAKEKVKKEKADKKAADKLAKEKAEADKKIDSEDSEGKVKMLKNIKIGKKNLIKNEVYKLEQKELDCMGKDWYEKA